MKKTIVLTIIMLAAGLVQAQKRKGPEPGHKFNFSFGLALATSNTVTTTLSDAGGTATITRNGSAFGFFAYPKYNVYSREKFSISVGVPLTFAFSGAAASVNSRSGTGEGTTNFLYDLPLMIDYNGGVMAPQGRNGESRIGYFGGIGIGIENTNASFSYVSTGYKGNYDAYTQAKSVGPNIHAGFVFRVTGPDTHTLFFGARLSYKIGFNSDNFNYFTPSVFMSI